MERKGNIAELQWQSERIQYGFDNRETWDMKDTMITHLYPRLVMYYNCADNYIDLDYHEIEYDSCTHTLRELVIYMMDTFEKYFKDNTTDVKKALGVLSVCIEYLWW